MSIYIAIAVTLFIMGFWEKLVNDNIRVYFTIFTLLLLVCFDGLRWENGTDWNNYYKIFYMLDSDDERFELGYVALNRIVYYLTGSYSVFLVLHAILLYGSLFFFAKRFSENCLLSIFLFFVMFLPYQGMNRQFLAIAICLLAFRYLVENDIKMFVLFVVVACFFHSSALIFLVSLLLTKRYSFHTYFYTLLIVVAVGIVGVVQFILDFGLNMLSGRIAYLLNFYAIDNVESAHGLGLVLAYARRLLWIVPVIYKMSKSEFEIPRAIVIAFNLYFFGCLLYIIFNGSILQIFVSRALLYFTIFECLLIPFIIYTVKSDLKRLFLYVVVLLYGIFTLYKGLQSYDFGGQSPFVPYKTLYYNTDVPKITG